MIRVLIVDDSPTVRALLRAVVQDDPQLQVAGEAGSGVQAVRLARELRPDVITMDVLMPEMDGLEATKQIMIESPTRIIIVSGHANVHEVSGSMQALRLGALTVLPKLPAPDSMQFPSAAAELVRTIKSMSSVKVVRHWPERETAAAPFQRSWERVAAPARISAIAVASSTGGPTALQHIFDSLPKDFSLPILVVQHMPIGFTGGLADWLNSSTELTVKLAEADEELLAGTVYIAPERRHLGVTAGGRRVLLSQAESIGGFQPSATFLFESVGKALGPRSLGVIMTGMGRDGVDGLRHLRSAGGRVIAQDEATSTVYGMPFEAVKEGLAHEILPLPSIPRALLEVARHDHARV